jgi:hypothetical protein
LYKPFNFEEKLETRWLRVIFKEQNPESRIQNPEGRKPEPKAGAENSTS